MSYLKSNMGMLKYFILTFQTHGHSVPTFLIRGHYINYFTHIQTTWAFRAHVF
jgi:hypothetical protein